MAPRRKNQKPDRRDMLAPIAALTRFRPDTSILSNHARDQAAYTRHGVKVGDTGIFLPYLERVEIVELQSVCPVPNTPMWFMGMIKNRGNLMPVFDLKLFMEMGVDQPSRWVMILGHGSKAAGLCIDSLPAVIENPQLVDADRNAVQTAIPHALLRHLAGTYMHNDKVWVDLAYDKLFHDLCARF